ncbi:hypothetical protein G7Y89_g15503 [Cudoniella acicularis]|uniref:HEAT repeat domain-containing protein n=1 Tax=Cudoniella acicularis TaxID=354080 RepID=A0A8H4QM64_9HELO|nr:hypothetical protein G7Y89_g15503 [Cudoniella acicularis]
MEVSSLTAGYENVPYVERMASLVELGKAAKDDSSAKQLIENLLNGSLYEQLLGLQTCFGSRDAGPAIRALKSPSRHLKKRAIGLVTLIGTDEQLLQALFDIPPYLQRYEIRRMKSLRPSRRRQNVIDQFLNYLNEMDPNSEVFQRFLPLASEALLEKHLKDRIRQFNALDWSRLASHHPDIAQRELHAWTLRSDSDDTRLLSIATKVIIQWSRREESADRALVLLKMAAGKIRLSKLPLFSLLEIRYKEVIELILEHEGIFKLELYHPGGVRPFTRMTPNLSTEQLLALFELYPDSMDSSYFYRCSLEQRRVIYSRVKEAWRSEEGIFPMNALTDLPQDLRIAEARRHLKLKAMEATPAEKIPYIALLPWDEAVELQTPFLRSSDSELRMDALAAQITAAKYNENHLGGALKLVLERKNDQDPIRRVMITALHDIPICRWKTGNLPQLEIILNSALDAADLSDGTLRQMLILVLRLLKVYPEWAGTQYAHIQQRRGFQGSRVGLDLTGVLPISQIFEALSQKMSPAIESALEKRNHNDLGTLAQEFRCDLKYWPDLLNAMEKALETQNSEDGNEYASMLGLLKDARPRSWFRVLRRLLERGQKGGVDADDALEYVQFHEPNLLQYYFKDKTSRKPLSHYWQDDTLDRLDHGFWRWTPAQQDVFAGFMLKGLQNPEVTDHVKLEWIRKLPQLPFVDPKHILHLCRVGEKLALRDTALVSLGKLDGGQGVPVLLESLQDERARVAIFGIRGMAKLMSEKEMLKLLQTVPTAKVIVAKEVVRLIGELGTEEAFQHLLNMEKTDIHKNVRIALFQGLEPFLDRSETWEILNRATQDPGSTIAQAICQIPDDGASSNKSQQILKLLLQLLHHPKAEVRLSAINRFLFSTPHTTTHPTKFFPLLDNTGILFPRLSELMFSPIKLESEAAAKAIFTRYAKTHHELVGDCFRRILTDRRILQQMHGLYIAALGKEEKSDLVPCTRNFISILEEDKLTVSLRLSLIFHGIPFNDQLQYLLAIMPYLHADALHEACSFISRPQVGR